MPMGQDCEAFIGSTTLVWVALQHAFVHCIRCLTLLQRRSNLAPVETERTSASLCWSVLSLLLLVYRKLKRTLSIKSTTMAYPAIILLSECLGTADSAMHGLNCHQSCSCSFSRLDCLEILVLSTVLRFPTTMSVSCER